MLQVCVMFIELVHNVYIVFWFALKCEM